MRKDARGGGPGRTDGPEEVEGAAIVRNVRGARSGGNAGSAAVTGESVDAGDRRTAETLGDTSISGNAGTPVPSPFLRGDAGRARRRGIGLHLRALGVALLFALVAASLEVLPPWEIGGGSPAQGAPKGAGGEFWQPLGGGTNGSVYALAVSGSGLYVGGTFAKVSGDSDAAKRYLIRWDDTGWNALRGSADATVYALAVSADALYAGGGTLPLSAACRRTTWPAGGLRHPPRRPRRAGPRFLRQIRRRRSARSPRRAPRRRPRPPRRPSPRPCQWRPFLRTCPGWPWPPPAWWS